MLYFHDGSICSCHGPSVVVSKPEWLHTVFVKARCHVAHACKLGFSCVGHSYGVFLNSWMSCMVYAPCNILWRMRLPSMVAMSETRDTCRYNLHAFIISSSGVVKILHWVTRSIINVSLVRWANGLHESVSSSLPKSWLRYFRQVSNHGKLRYGRVSVLWSTHSDVPACSC